MTVDRNVRTRERLLRELPQIQRLLEAEHATALCETYGRSAVTSVFRSVLEELRDDIRSGALVAPPDAQAIVGRSEVKLARRSGRVLRRAINATGIVLHTNLGRAPLAAEAIDAVAEVARAYCNVELDLESGKRGSRTQSIEPLLQALSGCEAALAVNNGAAAILLALSALAEGGEVVVSRGELVEIGGGFRVPDIIRQGGARLVEVGSTNKTRLSDYRAAIGPATRILLKVHQSNFRMIGFTDQTSISDLSGLAREHNLLLVADLGSGLVQNLGAGSEPTLGEALGEGADIVTCSGDKLLGGPQAGLILGQKAALDRIRKHPLLRAVRLDKMSLAALEATLILHRDRPEAVPVLRMFGQSEEMLRQRAERLRSLVGQGIVESSEAFAGGGALPEERIASFSLRLPVSMGDEETAALLRAGHPAVICRIKDRQVIADMLSVSDDEVPELAARLRAVLA